MDTVIFITSKFIKFLISPDTWLILLIGLGLFASLRLKYRLERAVLFILFTCLVTLAVFPLGQTAVAHMEGQYSPPKDLIALNGIVVLGGGEQVSVSRRWNTISLGAGAERLTKTVELARRFPDAKITYVGGSGRLRDSFSIEVSEAEIASRFFVEQGISSDRIRIDSISRNTSENAANSLLISPAGPNETWVLITSAFHMKRALRSFKMSGWPGIIPYPVDYRTSSFRDGLGWNLTSNLEHLGIAVQEIVASFAYKKMKK